MTETFQTPCGLRGRIDRWDEFASLLYFVDRAGNHMDIPPGITYHNPNYINPLPIPKYYIILLCDGEYTIKRYGKHLMTCVHK